MFGFSESAYHCTKKWKHFRADFEKFQSKFLIDHKNALVFHQTVSGMESSPEGFLTGEPNTNKEKNSF